MFIIAGLGNPGRAYEKTRHNVGFCVVDKLAAAYGISVTEEKYHALAGNGYIEGNRVLLLKPQTYMNESGLSVREAVDFYKADPASDLIVIVDDIDLPLGQLRIRRQGSAGGHKGLKSIISRLGTQQFARMRIGIGAKPPLMDLADHVLSHFPDEEWKIMDGSFSLAAEAVVHMMDDVDMAMNRYNIKRSEDE